VIRLFKDRTADGLGRLEIAVMEIVWSHGRSSVREVAGRMDRPLAYTTIMTTLDRLYKKGMLDREKSDRAFLYSPRWSRLEWEQKRAGDLLAGLLADSRHSGEALISCLVDAVGPQNQAVLEDLERKIRRKRQELGLGKKS
jgi:predicted transcriptional regulator